MLVLTKEPARPARVRDWPHAWKLATATVCFGAFMGQLDASIVTLTYRPLEHQFHAGPAAVQWVSLSYLLALVVLLAPIGRRSDRVGRKLSYLHGFVIFSAGSALCGLAPDLGLLVAARIVQGAGAALLQANSVAIVTTTAPRHRMRAALGVQAAAQALGLALGPTVGGIIVATVGWRWVYAINVPVGVAALAAGVLFLPRTTTRATGSGTDLKGSLLIGLSLTAGLLALSAVGGLGLPVPALAITVLFLLAGSGALAVARHLRRAPDPVISPAVLSAPGVATGLVVAMVGYLVLFGPLVLVPAVLTAHGVSTVAAGLILTALPAGFALAATLAGGALPRSWSDYPRSLCGLVLSGAALTAMLMLPLTAAWLAASLGLLGLGLGVLAPANNASVMRAIPTDCTASAGGIISMTRALGTAIGISAVVLALHLSGPRLAVALLLGAVVAGLFVLRSGNTLSPNMPGHGGQISRTGHKPAGPIDVTVDVAG